MAFKTKINKALITSGYDKHGPGMNAPGTKGYAKWEEKEVNRKANEGIGVKPYTEPTKTGTDWIKNLPGTTPRKPVSKPASKMAALGSDKRKAQYDEKGWKYDDTIKGFNRDGSSTAPKPRKKVEAVKAIESKGVSIKTKPTDKVDIKKKPSAPKAPKAKQSADTVRKNKSISKKQAKADAARASGNTKKADRKERAIARKKSRMASRAKK